ncbi:MAG: molybdenum cofactor biosynthesis protein B [Polyangiaceae bacterium]
MNDAPTALRVVTVTVSDTRTEADDEGGKTLRTGLESAGFSVVRHAILRDEPNEIQALIDEVTTTQSADAIVLTGGTGISPRDRTYEAVSAKLDLTLDGFGEAFRRLSWDQIGPRSILSRATAGVARGVVVISLPGSVKAVELAVRELITPTLAHAVALVRGDTRHHHHDHPSHTGRTKS